jgi:hypothetical protein
MRQFILLLLFAGTCSMALAQTYRVTGKITNAAREPVSLVSVQVQGMPGGTLSKDDGSYLIQLEAGSYNLVFSIVGYKTQRLTLTVTKDYVQNIILETSQAELENFTLKTKYKDPAVEIIRNVIRRKDSLVAASGAWSCRMYIKAVQQDSLAVALRKPKTRKDSILLANRDLSRMAMSEIVSILDFQSEQKIKEERVGVKRIGSNEDLFYLSATEGFFNFYNNLLKVPGLSTAQFLSPVSYSGLLAYRFKTLQVEKRGAFKWYRISVRGRQMSNGTVEGELTINDSSWTISHARFQFPKYHLPQYDYFETEQWFEEKGSQATLPTRQQFTYNSKTGKGKLSGVTSISYVNYEVNKQFPKNHFGDEISATTDSAYRRDSSFWQAERLIPLTTKEIRLIQYRDSIYRVTHTKQYLDSIDHLTNKFTWKKLLLTGQTLFDRELDRTWVIPPLPSVYQPFGFGGTRLRPSVGYYKTYTSRKNLRVLADFSYGFRNKDLNGSVSFNRMYNPFNRGFYGLSVRRDFDFIFEGDAWINMLKRSNMYLNNSLGVKHGLELVNGLFLYSDLDLAFRKSLESYKIGSAIDSIVGDALGNNRPIGFDSYNALYGKLSLEYTPNQRYIREPREKIILGSKWPTFYTTYRKGFRGVFNSKTDFDFWSLGIKQELQVGLFGILRYNAMTGTFLRRGDLRIVDYEYQRRGDPLLFQNPDYAFQALDSSFAVFRRYYQGHLVHEFNGYLLNKIPLLKNLQLREVAGAGFLIAPERNLRYAELFAGVERVFAWPFNVGSKFKLGVYVVSSVANKYNNPLTFKIGITSWDKRRNRWF